MTLENSDLLKKSLEDLNIKIAQMETVEKVEEARKFFEHHLSDQLIFRRANGKVVGKSGSEGVLDGLKDKRFKKLKPEDINVMLLNDRALVTLIVVGTGQDGSIRCFRNIRLFTRAQDQWLLEFWYNYEITGL
jgi:hypothetical protein